VVTGVEKQDGDSGAPGGEHVNQRHALGLEAGSDAGLAWSFQSFGDGALSGEVFFGGHIRVLIVE
jgi:hypothetical protein